MTRVQHIFILDNRVYQPESFEEDAAYAAYHKLSSTLIRKYAALSDKYKSWLSDAFIVGIAASPEKMKIMKTTTAQSILKMKDMLQDRFSCTSEKALIPHHTWGTYFHDAVLKLNNEISVLLRNKSSHVIRAVVVTFISTDLALLGSPHAQSISESILKFSKAMRDLCKRFSSVKCRILCSIVSDTSIAQLSTHNNFAAIGRFLKDQADIFTFHQFTCSPVHFEGELRTLMEISSPTVQMAINFPASQCDGSQCALVVELKASTVDAATVLADIQDSQSAVQLCALIGRKEVDATFIDGKGLRVTCPHSYGNSSLLTSSKSQQQNVLIYQAVAEWLNRKDEMILLKLSVNNLQHVWLLVPSEPERSQNPPCCMAMVRLADRDDVIIDKWPSGHDTSLIIGSNTVSNALIMDDLNSYLEESVERALGTVKEYNPMAYSSGKKDQIYKNLFGNCSTTMSSPRSTPSAHSSSAQHIPYVITKETKKNATDKTRTLGMKTVQKDNAQKSNRSEVTTVEAEGNASHINTQRSSHSTDINSDDNEESSRARDNQTHQKVDDSNSPLLDFASFATNKRKRCSTKGSKTQDSVTRGTVAPKKRVVKEQSQSTVSQPAAASKPVPRLLKRKFAGGIKTVGEWQ